MLDPVYGCKEESFCEITFCCLALTAECLACGAGVPVELYCLVNPKTNGCDAVEVCDLVEPPFDPCSVILCSPVSRRGEREREKRRR